MNNEEKKYIKLTPFKMQVLQSFPYIDADFDALTNYELLCKVVDYLNQTIDNVDVLNDEIEEYINKFNELKSYVDNYFDNLDVQEEINNKLDEMATDGSLTNLIKAYVDPIYEAYEDEINEDVTNFKSDINQEINTFESSINTQVININNKVNSAVDTTPIPVASTSDMTDTTKIYVNTTDGKWYYYNGSNWTIGGTYQSTGLVTDKTLSKNNEPADGYSTGDYLKLFNDNLFNNEIKEYKLRNDSTFDENVVKIDQYYQKLDGTIANNSAYCLYYFYIKRNCKIYFPNISSAFFWIDIFDNCNPNEIYDNNTITGQRLIRIDKDDLPSTEENAIELLPSQVFVISMGYQTSDNNRCKTNAFDKMRLLNNNIILNTNQLNQINENILVEKDDGDFKIYIPSKINSRYLRFILKNAIVPTRNENSWRLYSAYIVDSEFNEIVEIQSDMEWESVLRVNGESDFIGGWHGFETFSSMNILIDNILYTPDSADFNRKICKDIKLVTKSIVTDHNEVDFFERLKVEEFNLDEVTIYNKWKALTNMTLNEIYFSMCSVKDNIIQYGRNGLYYINTDIYNHTPVSGDWFSNTNTNLMECWGTYLKYTMTLESNYTHLKAFGNIQNPTTMNKSYISAKPSISSNVTTGDTFEGKTHFKFIF